MRTDATVEEVYTLGPRLGTGGGLTGRPGSGCGKAVPPPRPLPPCAGRRPAFLSIWLSAGFSKVRLATRRADGQQFAAKVVPLPRAGATVNEHCCSRARILAEVEALVGLQHPHIVRLHEYFVTKHHVYLITELLLGEWGGRGQARGCARAAARRARTQAHAGGPGVPTGGEVLDALNQQEEGHFSEGEARTIFRQLMDAVAYLHSCGIVHRDIKLDNLLLAQPGDIEDIKIVDFGCACACCRGAARPGQAACGGEGGRMPAGASAAPTRPRAARQVCQEAPSGRRATKHDHVHCCRHFL